jgi:hypothetical protein
MVLCEDFSAFKLEDYVRVLVSVWIFLFITQPKEVFFDSLKKLEQRSHNFCGAQREYIE